MKRLMIALILLEMAHEVSIAADGNTTAGVKVAVAKDDWPWWRGPYRNGIAAEQPDPPVQWSETENVVWKTPIPGKGHGSVIVAGDQIFLLTADYEREAQSVLCLDRNSGRQVWQKALHQGGFNIKGNQKSTLANSTPAFDGERIYVNFLHEGAIYTTCLDRDGNEIWQKKINDYVLHQGFASSPAIYGDLVIVSADTKGGTGVIVGLKRKSGDLVWSVDRPKLPNYTSPIILQIGGRDQLVFAGCNLVTSLDPQNGKKIWEIPGSTEECVTSAVTDGEHIYTSGGYPRNHVAAIRADGSGKVAWENTSRVYVPSMVLKDGYLYAVLDAGVATCWNAATGAEQWKERIGGTFSSSLVLVGDKVYATDESGLTHVFKANSKGFEQLAQNQLGDECFATPAFCGGRIYARVARTTAGVRQEYLYCIGKASK